MLGDMSTKARGLPGGWALPIGLGWLSCVRVVAWLSGRDVEDSTPTRTMIVALGISALGLALGVAMAKQRRTGLILLAVVAAALLATLANGISVSDQEVDSSPGVAFFLFMVVLGVPAYAGALLVAMGRRLSRSRN
jgi:hypothetical protein